MDDRSAKERSWGRPPVGNSRDLSRIMDLPRRELNPADGSAAEKWTAWLARPPALTCDCVARWGYCVKELRPIQGWALEEACLAGGLLAPIGVGFGKTGVDLLLPMAMPGVQRAVLLIPPNLKIQLLERDIPQWGAHFELPNIAGGKAFTPGRPSLHIIAYSELSSPAATDLLTRIRPDLIIADEAHCLRHKDAARTRRFLRYLAAQSPAPRFCALSGTLTTRSLLDYAHLSQHALGEGSPLPLHFPTLEEWAAALDAETSSSFATPPGALERLAKPGEDVRAAFRRRRDSSRGVVATDASSIGTTLLLRARHVDVPDEVSVALESVRQTWQRPDGEELTESLEKARVLREIASGLYYRWRWPRGEPEALIHQWLDARGAWNREVRDKLERAREHLDSPGLLQVAAERWHRGFALDGRAYPPTTRHPLTWGAMCWPAWRDIRESCDPDTEAVWIDPWLVQDAVEWAREAPGIVWYEHSAFGRAVATAGDLPMFGGGDEADRGIAAERGDRSIVVSIHAHGTGKNLQVFARNLLANLPTAAGAWEQLLGRTHRPGQKADAVTADIYQHTPELVRAFSDACACARYVGPEMRLCYADREGL